MTTPLPTPLTQPAPAFVETASYALACVLDDEHLDLDVRLTLLEALRILTDAHPAYDPVTEPLVVMTLVEGLGHARRALVTVLAVSSDIGDLLRAARTAQVLAALPATP